MPVPYSPDAFRIGMQAHDQVADRIARKGMSARQMDLNRRWAWYKTDQYESRRTAWDGSKVLSDLEKESIAHNQVIPQGFWDPSGRFDEVPLQLRKPSAPYHLVRVVVNRFTGLLFSAKMHPQVRILGAPEMQAWVEGLIKCSRLWIRMALVRTYGGSMGSVAMTYQFRNGKPCIEVHDSRWCFPTFTDRAAGEMSRLEIRFQYPLEQLDAKGVVREIWMWFRRVIDQTSDVVYAPVPVGEGDEPQWVAQSTVNHNLGELPGVWVRNSQTDDQDGEEDCVGLYDTQETIDGLLSQASQGARENSDPTFMAASDELKIGELRKGSFNALKLEKGGDAKYIEMTGGGVDSAVKMIETNRKYALEVAQCVLDSETGALTATEAERRYGSMYERGDLFREQYGEMGIKPLIGKMVRGALKLRAGMVDPVSGIRTIGQVFLSPVVDQATGQIQNVDLPFNLTDLSDSHIELVWPAWVKRGPADAQLAAGAIATARTATAIDLQSSVEYLAPYFNVDDPAKALAAIQAEETSRNETLMGDLALAGRQPAVKGPSAAMHPNANQAPGANVPAAIDQPPITPTPQQVTPGGMGT